MLSVAVLAPRCIYVPQGADVAEPCGSRRPLGDSCHRHKDSHTALPGAILAKLWGRGNTRPHGTQAATRAGRRAGWDVHVGEQPGWRAPLNQPLELT
ncbi:hypothetical protein E2C01_015664 [Portunus trituberculatus]|uniref:Uncharacterized protein n=1 Tax=Portunus trituberculatus TaxID=210409 RepID=A0A5B7DNP7_PORTR|nr:hypothetical protein [Portunus trituberculatus]